MIKTLNDRFSMNDKVGIGNDHHHRNTLWARTQIIGGYGLHKNPETGLSELDEVVFETENMVPIGGVQFAMEQIFGVKGSLTEIPSLNKDLGIAAGATVKPTAPNPHAYGTKVCLFGIGVSGSAENNLTAKEVKYRDSAVDGMVPFRYTNETLSADDQKLYFGKVKKADTNTTAYYLKRFDGEPVIKHYYDDSTEDGVDGSEVKNDVFTKDYGKQIQTLTEMNLIISKKDIKEWFTAQGNVEESRVNSIALYSAVYDANAKLNPSDKNELMGDYADIHLFSKLNIPTEPMSLTKDMHIIYRVYGS